MSPPASPRSGICFETQHQSFEIVGSEGHVGVKIADVIIGETVELAIAGVEGENFRSEVLAGSGSGFVTGAHERYEVVFVRKALDDLIGPVGSSHR